MRPTAQERLRKIIDTCSKPAPVILSTAILLAFFIVVMPAETAKAADYTPEGKAFDTAFFYSPVLVHERIGSYGDTGRAAYVRARWRFDLAFPLIYGCFCLCAISYAAKKLWLRGSLADWLVLLPLGAVVFDLAENTIVSILMVSYPRELVPLHFLASLFTLVKWICVVPAMGLAVALPIAFGISRLRTDKAKSEKDSVGPEGEAEDNT